MLSLVLLGCILISIIGLTRKRFEIVLPPVVLSMVPILMFLGFFKKLSYISYVLSAILLIFIIITLYKKPKLSSYFKEIINNFFTPSLLCFAVVSILMWHATKYMVIWWNDDIVHWALEPKSLFIFDGFVDGAKHLNLTYANYPPAIALLQWWGMHILGEFSEPMLYFVLFLIYTVLSLPLFTKMKWKHCYFMPVVIAFFVIFPMWGNMLSYVFLSVDTVIGLSFGAMLLQIIHINGDENGFSTFNLFSLTMYGIMLLLVKEIGILFFVFAITWFLLTCQKKKEKLKQMLVVFGIPLLFWGSWSIFCILVNRVGGYHSTTNAFWFTEILKGTYVLPQGHEGLFSAFVNSLIHVPSDFITFYTMPFVKIPRIFWLCIIPIASFIICLFPSKYSKLFKKSAYLMTIITLFYIVLQYASFYTIFYHEVAMYVNDRADRMGTLIERYFAPISLAFAMLFVEQLLNSKGKGRYVATITGVALAILVAISFNYPLYEKIMIPDNYIMDMRSVGIDSEVREMYWFDEDLEGLENTNVLVGLEVNSDYVKNFRYVFAPHHFTLPQHSFIENSQTLADYLNKSKITHIICFDDVHPLANAMLPFISDEYLETYTVYDVQRNDKNITLEPAYY